MKRVPTVITQSQRHVMYSVPSKSEPGGTHITEFKPSGERDCECLGVHWFKIKDEDHMKLCRHQKMTTTRKLEGDGDPMVLLEVAVRLIRNKANAIFVALNYINCQHPDRYDERAVHCTGCPLYPKVCNIHKIHYGHRGKLPLIWRLQTAVYNGRRKDAEKLLVMIRREAKKVKP